ncbi:MAG: pseudouridine synthase [Evtepia gabavorous]
MRTRTWWWWRRRASPSTPSQGHHGDTLANFLLAHYRDQGLVAAFHPVNRLDRGTSGLMAVAKHAHAHERLQHQLRTGSWRAPTWRYAKGVPVPRRGCVDQPISRLPGSVLKRQYAPRAPGPGPTMPWSEPAPGEAWWRCAWRPGGPTRSGCTWRF